MYAKLVYPVAADTIFKSDANRASLLSFSKCLLPIAKWTDPEITCLLAMSHISRWNLGFYTKLPK
jgi:hypothetical protein